MLDTFRKCLGLVERKTAWQAVVVAGLVAVTAALEAFGIGLIFVFVNALVDPAQLRQLAWIGEIVGPAAGNDKELLILIALGLLGTFVVKNLLLLVVYYFQTRFVNTNEALLAIRLLDSYLNGAYALHLSRNSAEFIRNLTDSIMTVFSTVIMGFINLASEFVLITVLTTVLFMIEPLFTLGAILILGLAVVLFFSFSKNFYMVWGEREQATLKDILQALQHGFHSIKEVKILGCQKFILSCFERPRRELAGIHIKLGTMASAPRLWVETVVVVSVLLAVVYILSTGGDSGKILAALTLFAAATFRMIPSMNRIIIALNGIKNGTHAVNLVHDDLHAFRESLDEGTGDGGRAFAFNHALAVKGLSFSYSGGGGTVLKDINFVLRKGESLGLVGPSGSGKTTLVNIVLGLLVPSSGSVTVDGADIGDATRAWRRQIGFVPQSIYIIDDTLRRNIAFGLDDDDIDDANIQNAVRLAQLEDLVRELPDGLETRLGERGVRLSGGQCQRVGIARALYRDPEVLILDEATSSLDTETEHEINNAINRLSGKKTLIIIAHRLSTVRNCKRLAFIKDGRLVDTGSFDELAASNAEFKRMVELSRL